MPNNKNRLKKAWYSRTMEFVAIQKDMREYLTIWQNAVFVKITFVIILQYVPNRKAGYKKYAEYPILLKSYIYIKITYMKSNITKWYVITYISKFSICSNLLIRKKLVTYF